jgi:glucose-6-phosphate 1-dehydrogenase
LNPIKTRFKLANQDEFVDRIRKGCETISKDAELFDGFVSRCEYIHGAYDSDKDFEQLRHRLEELEHGNANRMFYLAVPPSTYVGIVNTLASNCRSQTGWNRVVIEKPFGRDSKSSHELVSALGKLLSEEEQFRIDHYLGKEMVQTLLVLRFSNLALQPLWNRNYIHSVKITFKEDFGVEGRGGYFDEFGIIRDVMQNRMLLS